MARVGLAKAAASLRPCLDYVHSRPALGRVAPAFVSGSRLESASPWQFLLILLSFLLIAAANLAKFAVLVAIYDARLFPTSSGLVKALTHDLPPRPYPRVSYILAVFVCGTAIGLTILASCGSAR